MSFATTHYPSFIVNSLLLPASKIVSALLFQPDHPGKFQTLPQIIFSYRLASDLLVCIPCLADAVSLSMDAACCSPALNEFSVPEKGDPCPVCFVDFDGRDVVPVIVRTQCGHRYDLECIAKSFVSQPVGMRRCAMCRQDPMPLVNEDIGESYPDEFFPDRAFFIACLEGDLELVSFRLAQGINVNSVLPSGWTPLILSASKGQFEIVRMLLEKGAEVHGASLCGITALMLAVQDGKLEVVRLLIEKGARVNAGLSNSGRRNGCTALMLAAEIGQLKVVELLIESGANVHGCMADGYTALMLAAETGQLKVVELLIESGANVDVCAVSGGTALILSARNGHLEVVRFLIEKGAKVDAPRIGLSNGATALMLAAANGHLEVIKFLIEKGADVDSRAAGGSTALILAADNGQLKVVEYLIEKGAKANAGAFTAPVSAAVRAVRERQTSDCEGGQC